ncbi:CLUMA_CG002991, isoform A [Clunio marinus]|uniref:CLUMA_CG002991, isoform A n=1 Tax=Clunio marinus TaxID=568069 RepID=A0A1J1HMD7_9DIPT|nr:CLUMA_CG002991, isoform A [Clunio marinus]
MLSIRFQNEIKANLDEYKTISQSIYLFTVTTQHGSLATGNGRKSERRRNEDKKKHKKRLKIFCYEVQLVFIKFAECIKL